MERIGLISKDQRLHGELRKWLGDLFAEFEIVSLDPPEKEAASGDPPANADPPFKLVIFDASQGPPHANNWTLARFRDELKLSGIPWLAIGPESFAKSPHAPLIHGSDDLVLIPLDRTILLQKIEYLMAAGESVTPSFLYLAKAEFPIELGKPVTLTHLSETGCTINSARPLATGVEGTLMSKLFGDGELQKVEVRSVESTPHFEYTAAGDRQQFEIKLRFFGLKQEQLKNLRHAIHSKDDHHHAERDTLLRADGVPQQQMNVALLSHDSGLSAYIRASLEGATKIEMEEYRGLTRFQSMLLIKKTAPAVPGGEAIPESAQLLSQAFIGPKTLQDTIAPVPRGKVTLYYRHQADVFERVSPALREDETILGHKLEIWMRDASPLTKGLGEKDKESILETLTWAASVTDEKPETEISATYDVSAGLKPTILFHVKREEVATPAKGALLKIDIEEVAQSSAAKDIQHYEAILVDASLLTFDTVEKVAKLEQWLETFDVKNAFGNRPPIVVVNAKEKSISPQIFRGTKVQQLAYDFNDRRYQAEMFISLSRPELWTSTQLSVANLKTEIPAFLMRPAKAEAISEVSLVVEERAAIKKGTELLVSSPMWPSAVDGIWARVRTVGAKGEGKFANEFVFFGVGEAVQGEIRRFAREDYIRKKAQGS